jgi:lipopolysaccharide/colanic/teichoic acid biosynthesis glycosyltransferase
MTADAVHPQSLAAASPLYTVVKRVLDISAVLILALPASMLVLLAAGLVWATDGRPIFFAQDRVGRGGKIFRMRKLRTMATGTARVMHATLANDARITATGRFLRRSHLDELPQLWNILIGDMSLIGPRPEQPHLVDYYKQHIPGFELRHAVRPGLSGLAQVSFGYAADLEETREKFRYDLYYVKNVSPLLDLKICLRTIQVYANPCYVR